MRKFRNFLIGFAIVLMVAMFPVFLSAQEVAEETAVEAVETEIADVVGTGDLTIEWMDDTYVIPVDENYSPEEILALVDDTKFMIGDFKRLVASPMSFTTIIQWIGTIVLCLGLLGAITLLICAIIKIFTPPEVDVKIEKFEAIIRKILVDFLKTIVDLLRSLIRTDK